ncbi:MAG: SDR family oxidoreductase [Bacteroidota bacterium]|nr:SDR family oxidoreductase [Bacteroidota bacterium]
MYNLLKGKKGIIFGALDEKSMAWKVAEMAHEEGAIFTLSNTPTALRFGQLNELAKKTNSQIIPADATKLDDIYEVFEKSMEIFGGKIDFVLHSIGMSLNVRKKVPYPELNYNYYMKTLDISAISFHKVLQVAYKLDAVNKGGSIVALSYIAAQRTLYRYNDMADAKALLESIARSFGYIYGRERGVRVNTISQSPTRTTAGEGINGIDALMDFSERMSPLGNASAEDLAEFCISMFSDLTKKITMQNIMHDGGFSSMAMSRRAMHQYNKSLEQGTDDPICE